MSRSGRPAESHPYTNRECRHNDYNLTFHGAKCKSCFCHVLYELRYLSLNLELNRSNHHKYQEETQ